MQNNGIPEEFIDRDVNNSERKQNNFGNIFV